MKRFISISLVLFLVSAIPIISVAQKNYCGTDLPDHMMEYVKENAQKLNRVAQKKGDSVYHLPLKIHLVAEDDGSGAYDRNLLWQAVCRLNEDYDTTNFHFYIYNDINYIHNSTYYNYSSYSTGDQMMNTYNVDSVINVYINENPAGACGYYTPSEDAIALRISCVQPGDHTFAHEVGHYFSLPHPFINSADGSNPEYVDGSNCSSAGDYICDTRADYLDYRWACPYTGTQTDPKGDTINPDSTLFMSYSLDYCQARFTPTHRNMMRDYLNTNRSDLIGHTPPPYPKMIDSVNVLALRDGVTSIAPDYVRLKWESVPNAQFYHITTNQQLDTLVTDTVLQLTKLQPNTTYNWQIKPIHRSNTCGPVSKQRSFTTSDTLSFTPNITTYNTSCNNQNGAIAVDPTAETEPYSYKWAYEDSSALINSTSDSIGGLKAGTYHLTITDANKDSFVFPIEVRSNSAISSIKIVDQEYDSATAQIKGGTPPFTYKWSNGDRGPTADGLIKGKKYNLYVEDKYGCLTKTNFTFQGSYTGIENTDRALVGISIYPNPTTGEAPLKMEYTANTNHKARITIRNTLGKEIYTNSLTFKTGTHTHVLPLSDQQPGIYFVNVTLSTGKVINQKILLSH